jgi:hypothetical protein
LDAAALLAQLTASTGDFHKLVGAGYLSSEGVAYRLAQGEIDDLRAAHDTFSTYVVFRRNEMDQAEAIATKELLAKSRRART